MLMEGGLCNDSSNANLTTNLSLEITRKCAKKTDIDLKQTGVKSRQVYLQAGRSEGVQLNDAFLS